MGQKKLPGTNLSIFSDGRVQLVLDFLNPDGAGLQLISIKRAKRPVSGICHRVILVPKTKRTGELPMNTASEQWWEKKLNIRTGGKIDHFIEEACNPYEPTDYCILEALAGSGYITSESSVIDYGCGLGRLSRAGMDARPVCRHDGLLYRDRGICPHVMPFRHRICGRQRVEV